MKSRIASIIIAAALSLNAAAQGLVEDPTVAAAVTAEAATLFPRVGEVRLGRVGDDVVAHVMVIPSGEKLDTDRVRRWLRTRLQNGDLWVEFY